MPLPTVVAITPIIVAEGLGAFDDLEVLGSGGFGTTFRAVRGDDEYALKVMHEAALPEYLWEREIAAIMRVDHPNVMGFRRCGNFEAYGQLYRFLECEFIAGGTARAALDRGHSPTSPDDLKAFLSGLLVGIGEIHDLGIHHRDIKPENVAIRDGDWGQPVLLDFGLARVLDMSTHTLYPAYLGTTSYMSPEQLRGEPARTRSDLFSVGVVTYEVGTGVHPFAGAGTTRQAIHDRIAQGPPINPRQLGSKIWSDDLAVVVLQLMAYNAHERPSVERALASLGSR
jgi:eukaryotic-like serine/threonine-protein kinase